MREPSGEKILDLEGRIWYIEDQLVLIEREYSDVIEQINKLYQQLHTESRPYIKEDTENRDVAELISADDYLKQLKERPIEAVKRALPHIDFGKGMKDWDKVEVYNTVSFLEEVPRETRIGLSILKSKRDTFEEGARDAVVLELFLRLQFYREALEPLKKILDAEKE